MQAHEAMKLLGVHEPLRAEEIRRCYRKAALKHHPDKGGCSDEFHRICEAHDVLHAELGTGHRAERSYSKLVDDFLQAALGGSSGRAFLANLSQLASGCKAAISALSSLGNLEPQTCLSTLAFLEKHADLLHIDPGTIRSAREAFRRRQDGRPRFSYTLNASLDHMLAPDVYKLRHRDQELHVPLWHEDLVFDTSAGLVYVRCVPTLPAHISLDSHDNLHVDVRASPESILTSGGLRVQVGALAPLWIPGGAIKMELDQTIRCRGVGVPLINLEDVFATDKRGDILLHLKLSLAST